MSVNGVIARGSIRGSRQDGNSLSLAYTTKGIGQADYRRANLVRQSRERPRSKRFLNHFSTISQPRVAMVLPISRNGWPRLSSGGIAGSRLAEQLARRRRGRLYLRRVALA